MLCILELALFVVGIVLLIVGKIPVTANREVRGASARIVGAIFLLPVFAGLGGAVVYGAVVGAKKGIERSQQHRQLTPQDIQQIQQEVQGPAMVIHICGTIVPLLLGVGVALATMQPIKRKKRRRVRREEEYEEDDEDEGYDDAEPTPRARRRHPPPEDEDEGRSDEGFRGR